MTVRRKSLWRSQNSKRARKFANMRAANERKRLARLAAEPTQPDTSHTYVPKRTPPLFTVTIRCRDGERVRLAIREGAHGLKPCANTAAKKIAAVLMHYRPAP